MRLWSLHPRYLDSQGLVALWREALLARAVLQGKTRGYRQHPQLARFLAHAAPRSAICACLSAVHGEACAREYRFAAGKVGRIRRVAYIPVTSGQIEYEWRHLLRKLSKRDPALYRRWRSIAKPELHPLFRLRRGSIEPWERG